MNAVRPPKRRGDQVNLDVGGTVFSTSITTLQTNCSYFERLFSDEWRTNEEEDDNPAVFVDQDPGPFAVLLSFMRLRYVKAEDVTRDVLLQADFLGMDILLAAVKVVSYLNTDPTFAGSDEEACAAFDEEFGGIVGAVSSEILPSRLTDSLQRKEYAHLLISDDAFLEDRDDLVVCMDVPSCPVDEMAIEGVTTGQNYRYASFLDALNFLGRRGFTTLEKEIQDAFYVDSEIDRRLTFSRIAKDVRPSSDLSQMITHRHSHNGAKGGPKEYACIVDTKCPHLVSGGQDESQFVCVYADTGDEPVLEPAVHGMSTDRESRLVQAMVYTSKLPFGLRVAPGMDWLQKESYRKEENELGETIQTLWNKQWRSHPARLGWQDSTAEDGPLFLKLFSRRCRRRKDDYIRSQD